MERQTSTTEKNNDSKRKKLHLDSNKISITHFEDLSNELIYEIFEFINIYHLYQAFLNLNQRFQILLTCSTFPININLSSISTSIFQYYYQQIIIPNKHRIRSLNLSNTFLVNRLFSPPDLIEELVRLENLVLHSITSTYLNTLLTYLATLSNLRSLTIISIDQIKNKDEFYRSIFRLPILKYCKLSFESDPKSKSLSISTNESSSIEHLIINHHSTLEEFTSVISYVPQLRHLSWHHLSRLDETPAELQELTLKHLTHISLTLYYMNFDQFESVILRLFHKIEVLQISTSFYPDFVNSDRWERLISSYMPYLRVFDIQLKGPINFPVGDHPPLTHLNLSNIFNSSFWIEHQWFFAHQCFGRGVSKGAVFYSTNPYRRKSYTLYGTVDESNCFDSHATNFSTVRHVEIAGETAMRTFTKDFTDHRFANSIDETIDYLTRILPLTQITRLFINYKQFDFQKVIKVLQFTPNLHTLRLHSIDLARNIDCTLIEESETFQCVSKTNCIKNFTVKNECHLNEMRLLIKLCPRLEHINMEIYSQHIYLIFELIFLKTKDHLTNLFSLCLTNGNTSRLKHLESLIELNKWLDNYSMELVRSKLYLWW